MRLQGLSYVNAFQLEGPLPTPTPTHLKPLHRQFVLCVLL